MAILEEYRQQLETVREFGHIVHLPTAAISLLWQFRDTAPGTKIHFFDYGYEKPSDGVGSFVTFQGQITTPVNFGLLASAAKIMGYRVTLEKDREFIQRTTGHDTMIVGRIQGLDLHILGEQMETSLLLTLFGEAAQRLCPDAEVSGSTIRGLRVPRSAVEAAALAVKRDYSYKDGSFYFCAER